MTRIASHRGGTLEFGDSTPQGFAATAKMPLEEVEFDEPSNTWQVTLGFSRPWDEARNTFAVMAGKDPYPRRSFKIVRIHDPSQKVVSVKNREIAA